MKTSELVIVGAGVITATYIIKATLETLGKITNNLGQSWEATIDNLQPAINDSVGGWLRLPYHHLFDNIQTAVVLPSNTTIYGNGSTFKPCADFFQQTYNDQGHWVAYKDNNRAVIINSVIDGNNVTTPPTDMTDTNIHIYDLTVDGNAEENYPQWKDYDQATCTGGSFPGTWDARCPIPDCWLYEPTVAYDCIKFMRCDNSSLHNCRIINGADNGMFWSDGNNCLIENCEFGYFAEAWEGSGMCDMHHFCLYITSHSEGQPGTTYHGSDGFQIINSTFHDCYSDGLVFEGTMWSPVDPQRYPKNWYVKGCKAWNNYGGFWAEDAGPGTFEDCESYNNMKTEAYNTLMSGGIGFGVYNNAYGITFKNCKSHHNYFAGFQIYPWTGVTLDGCEAHDSQYGIVCGMGANNTRTVVNIPNPVPPDDCLLLDQYPNVPYIAPLGKTVIQNSHVWNVTGQGIISWGFEPTIINNTVENTGLQAIMVTGWGGALTDCHMYTVRYGTSSNPGCADKKYHGKSCVWIPECSQCFHIQQYVSKNENPGGEVGNNTMTNWCLSGNCTAQWPAFNNCLWANMPNVYYHDNSDPDNPDCAKTP
jgi:hypothetical protein